MSTPPVPHGQLPPLPKGAEVSAWGAKLPSSTTVLPPRMAMIMLLHISWLRSMEYATLLERQMYDPLLTALGGEQASEAGGVVGHRYAMNPKDSQLYETGEEIRALAVLEGEERDRCAKLAMQCHDIGLFGEDW